MDFEETNDSVNQSNRPENLVFRPSPELVLQLIEYTKNTSDDDPDLLTTAENIITSSAQLKTENQIEDLSQGDPRWN